ncbi:hypothetical protein AVEN_214209-1 [Araneus ventricosus]|uniref:Uncharacterized protein n=1 Tax=Araneus ventricosus TaxID=182803 RepID=A0A4Y2IUD0_ARAVE|nr:hypothetical protein AVEN_214209-1 [Araneus ventricosus]
MNSPDVGRQSEMVVYNVYSYLKELVSSKPNSTVKELFSQTQKVTADACGVSYRTVQRICTEADMTAAAEVLNNIPVFESPKEKKIWEQNLLQTWMILTKASSVREFYDGDECERPAVAKLRVCLIEKINFSRFA